MPEHVRVDVLTDDGLDNPVDQEINPSPVEPLRESLASVARLRIHEDIRELSSAEWNYRVDRARGAAANWLDSVERAPMEADSLDVSLGFLSVTSPSDRPPLLDAFPLSSTIDMLRIGSTGCLASRPSWSGSRWTSSYRGGRKE
jgi:hypothetical protein